MAVSRNALCYLYMVQWFSNGVALQFSFSMYTVITSQIEWVLHSSKKQSLNRHVKILILLFVADQKTSFNNQDDMLQVEGVFFPFFEQGARWRLLLIIWQIL